MLIAKRLETSQDILLCLLAFSIPFPYIVSPPIIVSCALVWLLQLKPKVLLINLKERKVLWIWIIYYLLFAVSYFYSTNKNQSLFDLQSKLSFILLPLIIGAGKPIGKKQLEYILLSFAFGVTCIALFCIIRALLIWHETHYTLILFYNNLVKGLDSSAVYQALYSFFSITILLIFPWEFHFKKTNLIKFALILIQLVFFVLLSSRTLLFLFFLLLIPIYFSKGSHYKQNIFIKAISIFSVAALFFLLFNTKNPVKQRYLEVIHTENGKIELKRDTTIYNFNNLTLRLFIWKTGIESIKEHNLWYMGAGNGDAQDIQNKKFALYKTTDPKAVNPLLDLNMHNMYLQSLIMIGIPGLIIFIFLILSPFFYIKYFEFNQLVFLFNFIMCVFLIQESSFQTQAGIIFYSFFSMIFWNYYYSNKNMTIVKNQLVEKN